MIKFNSVSKSFGPKKVLDNVSWEVEKGCVLGLVGPNGAGKSTILRLIAGVLSPDFGEVFVLDQKVTNNPNIKGHIAFVSDEFYFPTGSSLTDMKDFYRSFYPAFSDTTYARLLKIFPLDEKKSLSSFSKGMKRQASLVLLLSTHPQLILLDEAFDGLDPVMRLALKRYISDIIIDKQVTVLISSHNLRELEDICDTIALIDHENIVLNQKTDEYQNNYQKVQLAFNEIIDVREIEDLHPLHIEGKGRIYTVIFRGTKEEIEDKIEPLNPAIVDILPLSLEELFVYEMEDRGYGKSA